MAVKRDADGNIIEEQTKISGGLQQGSPTLPGQAPAAGVGVTVGPGKSPQAGPGQQPGYEAQTVLAGSPRGPGQEQGRDARTRIYRPGAAERGREEAAPLHADTREPQSSAMDDPPVGWLVVVRGPGQGNFVAVGNGSNSVGRDETDRARIDFGDDTISRRNHSTITYDPRGKKFYLQHGAGKNLTYLEGNPVLAPTELPGFSRITIGDTELLFVPLCCERFDWEDYS